MESGSVKKDLNQDAGYISAADEQSRIRPDETPATKPMGAYQSNRRDFLKVMGFGLGAATLAASCKTPDTQSVTLPYKARFNSTGRCKLLRIFLCGWWRLLFHIGKDARRPAYKNWRNTMSDVTGGGTSARVQALVLSFIWYHRIRGPMVRNESKWESASWDVVDERVAKALASAKNIRILSNTILSPTTKNVIAEFKSKFPVLA